MQIRKFGLRRKYKWNEQNAMRGAMDVGPEGLIAKSQMEKVRGAEIGTKQKTALCALRQSGNAMGKMRPAESSMAASVTGDRIANICDGSIEYI